MEKYAALVESSYTTEGDLRSKTNPGHGYPSETVRYTTIVKFSSEQEMKEWVINRQKSVYTSKNFEIIKYVPMSIVTNIEVKIENSN